MLMDHKIVKMFILPRIIYRFKTIQINIPITFFAEIEKNYLKIYMEQTNKK